MWVKFVDCEFVVFVCGSVSELLYCIGGVGKLCLNVMYWMEYIELFYVFVCNGFVIVVLLSFYMMYLYDFEFVVLCVDKLCVICVILLILFVVDDCGLYVCVCCEWIVKYI